MSRPTSEQQVQSVSVSARPHHVVLAVGRQIMHISGRRRRGRIGGWATRLLRVLEVPFKTSSSSSITVAKKFGDRQLERAQTPLPSRPPVCVRAWRSAVVRNVRSEKASYGK